MRCRKVSSPLPVLLIALGTGAKNLFGVAAHRDCPFHSELNRLVSVALIVGSPRVDVIHYASQCSPDFPPSLLTAMLRPPDIDMILLCFFEKSTNYLSSPMWRADFNAVCNACIAMLRIFGANARIFIRSATVFPINVAMYSIWVGAIV